VLYGTGVPTANRHMVVLYGTGVPTANRHMVVLYGTGVPTANWTQTHGFFVQYMRYLPHVRVGVWNDLNS